MSNPVTLPRPELHSDEFASWHRLDPRSLAIVVVPMLGAGAIYVVAMLAGGVDVADLVTQGVLGGGAIGAFVVRYLTSRFAVVDDAVQWRSGLLVHRSTQIATDRVQDVEISRPLLARFLGLASVIVSSAGGDGEIRLQYLDLGTAERFARHLHELVAGERAASAGPDATVGDSSAPTGPAAVLHRVAPAELRGWVLARVWPVAVVVPVAAVAMLVAGAPPVWLAVLPLVPFGLIALVRPVLDRVGLEVSLDGPVVRGSAGLTTIRRTSTRRERIQVFAATQLPFQVWRRTETVRFASADVTTDSDDGGTVREELALDAPVGAWRDLAAAMVGRPVAGADDLRRKSSLAARATQRRWWTIGGVVGATVAAIVAAVVTVGAGGGAATVAAAATLTVILGVCAVVGTVRSRWRLGAEGWRVTPDDLVVRSGLQWRRTLLLPIEKVQAVEVRAGLLQRRLGLATLAVDIAPPERFTRVVITDLAADDAHELRSALVAAGCRPLPSGT